MLDILATSWLAERMRSAVVQPLLDGSQAESVSYPWAHKCPSCELRLVLARALSPADQMVVLDPLLDYASVCAWRGCADCSDFLREVGTGTTQLYFC